jgi:NAD(P)-dependent dehydrogenase (short-subunit alcohol dehydrogenase family)
MVTDYMDASPDPEATLAALTNWHLISRLGEPKDIASLVCFLASKEASFITGAVWLIDGGALAWRGSADLLDLPPAESPS